MNCLPVVLAAVDDRDDVRMRELRDGARLAAEALDVVLVAAVLVVQDLQRDVALEQRVERAVDASTCRRCRRRSFELVPVRDQLRHSHRTTVPAAENGTSASDVRERVFPGRERLVELGVRDHERAEHADQFP